MKKFSRSFSYGFTHKTGNASFLWIILWRRKQNYFAADSTIPFWAPIFKHTRIERFLTLTVKILIISAPWKRFSCSNQSTILLPCKLFQPAFKPKQIEANIKWAIYSRCGVCSHCDDMNLVYTRGAERELLYNTDTNTITTTNNNNISGSSCETALLWREHL